MKIAAATFGCKINQYETSCIIDDFISHGWENSPFSQPADVYIINSCTVTNRTDYKSRNAIRKALKQKIANPNVKIVVTGCYSQLQREQIEELGDIDFILDNNHKDSVYQAVTQEVSPEFIDIQKAESYCEQSTSQMLDRHRAFLKVQDGCNFFCAYCAVAWARGPSRSREKEAIINQVNKLTAQGYKEFVLGGINLGLYGHEKRDGYHLENLIADITEIEDVKKIRLSSIEPQLFSEKLIDEIKNNEKICPHYHIPLQSGCDKILKSMGRHYTKREFTELIHQLYEIDPKSAIGLDVIIGLPGETEEDFLETCKLVSSFPLAYMHIFPYSRRPGTRAWDMPNQVDGNEIKRRVNILHQISDAKKADYITKSVKEKWTISGIVEKKKNKSSILSDHYIRAYINGRADIGELVKARVSGIHEDGVKAEISERNA